MYKTKYFNNKSLVALITKDFKIDYHGDHGISHWKRVYRNTQILAKHYNIESDVFELFALIHDSKRENEYHDPAHGLRASIFVEELLKKKIISLSKEESEKLIFACKNHTLYPLADDLIVQICFDSDRLDLGRVGMRINTDYLSTNYAKSLVEDGVYKPKKHLKLNHSNKTPDIPKIIIMRHAKVLIKNRKIYANELREVIKEYDITPIETNIKNHQELLEVANSCNYFVSSGLGRSVDTLALLGKEPDYINRLFAEVESPYTKLKIMKLPLFTWGFWFKLAWFMGFSGGSKSYRQSKIEAFEASKILIKFAREYGAIFLSGHGLKNRLIAKALKKQGWRETKKMGMDNLEYGVFEWRDFDLTTTDYSDKLPSTKTTRRAG